MKNVRLSLPFMLTLVVLGAGAAWGATASFTPPRQDATIFASSTPTAAPACG